MIPWDDGRVLRFFPDWYSESDAVRELERIDQLWRSGAPLPVAFGIDVAAGRLGVIEENTPGPTMLDELSSHPWRARPLGIELAELQLRVHSLVSVELPAGPGGGEQVGHGRLSPACVILSPQGPVVIGWGHATACDPAYDIAATLLELALIKPPPDAKLNPVPYVFHRRFVQAYRRRIAQAIPLLVVGPWLDLAAEARRVDVSTPESGRSVDDAVIDILRSERAFVSWR